MQNPSLKYILAGGLAQRSLHEIIVARCGIQTIAQAQVFNGPEMNGMA